MVASEIDDFQLLLLNTFEDVAYELGVILSPFAAAFELPSVDDIAVENQELAACVLQEMDGFLGLAIESA